MSKSKNKKGKNTKPAKTNPAKGVNKGKLGRPRAEINVPNKRFTFADLVKANPHVKGLTLRKFLDRDMNIRNEQGEIIRTNSKSTVVLLRGEKGNPDHPEGLGRKTLVYLKRVLQENGQKNAANLKKHKSTKVSVPMDSPAPVPAPVIDAALTAAENADNLIAASAPEPDSAPSVAEPAPAAAMS